MFLGLTFSPGKGGTKNIVPQAFFQLHETPLANIWDKGLFMKGYFIPIAFTFHFPIIIIFQVPYKSWKNRHKVWRRKNK